MTRTSKTQTAKAVEQQVHIDPVIDTNGEDLGWFAQIRTMAAGLGVELPSGRMLIAGTVVQLITAVLGGYSAIQFSGYVALGVLMLSGSSFLSMLIAIIAAAIGIVAALFAASRAGAYVATGGVERDLKRVGNFFAGFFKKSEPKVA